MRERADRRFPHHRRRSSMRPEAGDLPQRGLRVGLTACMEAEHRACQRGCAPKVPPRPEDPRADADRQREGSSPEAYRSAQQVKGDGDATAIYADGLRQGSASSSPLPQPRGLPRQLRGQTTCWWSIRAPDFFRFMKDAGGALRN